MSIQFKRLNRPGKQKNFRTIVVRSRSHHIFSFGDDPVDALGIIKLQLADFACLVDERTAFIYKKQMGIDVYKRQEIGKVYVEAGGDDIYHDKLEPEVLKLPIKYEEDIL